jgi:signal transduction histidine kinase
MTMHSLRGRLGVLVAVGAFVITFVAAAAIAIQQWDDATTNLPNSVEFAAFRFSETQEPTLPAVDLPIGTDEFAVLFDETAEVIDISGDVSPNLIDLLISDVWAETTEQDVAVTTDYSDGGTRVVVSGVPCVDQGVCDTVVVGAAEEPLSAWLGMRALWLIGPALLAGIIGLVASRWLVGRSLQPVDRMREELESITATDLDSRVGTPDTGDELERLGEALNETIARLGAAVSANERFVADAAHELRSPITGVRAALELEASEPSPALIEDSIRELDRASRLIDDLLVLARRQAGALVVEDVDLDDIVSQECIRAAARLPDIEIGYTVEPVRMTGDTDALRRVVANLVENACAHAGKHVAVTLTGQEPGCRFRVDDDGPGVPPQSRSAIFERFARLDDSRSRRTGGSGLGLAIVSELVSAHDGTVTVTDSPLGGARFEVNLPGPRHSASA